MSEKVTVYISEWSDEKLKNELKIELDYQKDLSYFFSFIDKALKDKFNISLMEHADANAQHIIAIDEELKSRSNYYPNNLN